MSLIDLSSDEHKEEKEENKKSKSKPSNASVINDKLKEKLTQENIAQLIEKLLSSHQLRNSKPAQIVVVAPAASQPKNASNKVITTKVTTTKPKAFNLKIAVPKEDKLSTKNKTSSSSGQSRKKSTQVASVKRRPSSSSRTKTHVTSSPPVETTTAANVKVSSGSKSRNYKAKIYEKEIDILLQKIEKLEKQQNVKIEKEAIPERVTNSDLFKGRPTDIADKIKGFLSGVHSPEESSAQSADPMAQSQGNEWQALAPPPPPPPPPIPPPMGAMPFMPFMPVPAPVPSYGGASHSMSPPESASRKQAPSVPYGQPLAEHYPKKAMPLHSGYQEQFQQVGPNQQQQVAHNFEHSSSVQYDRPRHNSEYMTTSGSEMHASRANVPAGHSNQAYNAAYDSGPNEDSQMHSTKRKKSSLFGGKFKLSNILNSVMPGKMKKNKNQELQAMKDNRNIHEPNPPFEPMMSQESQMYPNVDRGQMYAEHPGMSINLGGGPMGGGGHMKANPMSFLRSMLPLSSLPKWINGKVVLGIVLENGIGKKPKTIFQHFSTGRIRR